MMGGNYLRYYYYYIIIIINKRGTGREVLYIYRTPTVPVYNMLQC